MSRKDDGTVTFAMQGKFHDLREQILTWCGIGTFVFFFIDPTGWKNVIELPTLDPFLRRPNSEFLINFMYDFLSRTLPQPEFQDDMHRIFGVYPDTQGMTPEERENHLITLYRNNLKQVIPPGKGKPQTAYVKVQKPTRDRTLYHLVYLTRHPKGIVEFMEASEKLDIVQKKLRAHAKQDERVERTQQFELFSAIEHVIDGRTNMDLSEIKEYWLKLLTTVPRKFGIQEFADMLECTDWFPSDFQRAFRELAHEGKVSNLDAKRARPVNVVNFEKNETLVRIQP